MVGLNNGYLASGSSDKTIKIWDVKNGKAVTTLDKTNGGHTSSIWSMGLLDSGYLVSSSVDVKIWKINNDSFE